MLRDFDSYLRTIATSSLLIAITCPSIDPGAGQVAPPKKTPPKRGEVRLGTLAGLRALKSHGP